MRLRFKISTIILSSSLFLGAGQVYAEPQEPTQLASADEVLARLSAYEQKILNSTKQDKQVLINMQSERDQLVAQRDKLIEQVGTYRDQIRELEAGIKAKESSAAEVDKKLSNQDVKIATLQSELITLKSTSGEKESALAETNQKLADSTAKIDALSKELDALKTEKQNLTADKQAETQKLAKQSAEKTALLEKFKTQLKAKLGDLNQQLETANVKIAEAEKHAAQQQQLLMSQEREIMTFKQHLQVETQKRQTIEQQDQVKGQNITSLSAERDKNADLVNKLTAKLQACQDELKASQSAVSALYAERSKHSELVDQLREQLQAQDAELKKTKLELDKVASDKTKTLEQLNEVSQKAELAKSMESELVTARNQLLMKETELNMLNGEMDPATKPAAAKIAEPRAKLNLPTPSKNVRRALAPTATTIVEVTADKVNLRNGPDTEETPLMQVQKGTRLSVVGKLNDWYQVYTPTGSLAFVQQQVTKPVSGETQQNAAKTDFSAAAIQRQAAPDKPVARVIDDDSVLVPFGSEAGPKVEQDEVTQAFQSIKQQIKSNRP